MLPFTIGLLNFCRLGRFFLLVTAQFEKRREVVPCSKNGFWSVVTRTRSELVWRTSTNGSAIEFVRKKFFRGSLRFLQPEVVYLLGSFTKRGIASYVFLVQPNSENARKFKDNGGESYSTEQILTFSAQ